MKIAVDNPYVTKDDFVNSIEAMGLGITATSADNMYQSGQLDLVLLRASAWVNRYCKRWFDTQTIDEKKTRFTVRPYNPQLVTVILNNRPYQKINSVYLQVLQWFIQIDITSASGILQDFPDEGFYKIVPLLSSAGTGAGSPLPAAIVDRVPLGVLWTNYTFGYGTDIVAQALTDISTGSPGRNQYQAPVGLRLFAPDQSLKVYLNGNPVASTAYTVDYPNGIITFNSANNPGDVVTADYVSNESVPYDIKEAVILLATHMIGHAQQNALGAQSYNIQTYSVNLGDESTLVKRAKEILDSFVSSFPMFF